jgi:nucleotide-binding universal stress UspA family protein
MEHEAHAMMASRFTPALQFTGVEHSVDLLRLRVHKSAAGIGEALAARARDVGADLMVIASHGAGVLADYGSVARWCSDNSRVPALLIPPGVLRAADAPPSNAVVVAAVDDLQGLRRAFDFAVRHLTRPGDALYVMHAARADGEDAGVAARKQLVADVARWHAESGAAHAATLNVAVELITEAPAAAGPDAGGGGVASEAGERLCRHAADLGARAVVLHHHGRSMMRDMMYGAMTAHCTKQCCRPLLLLGASDPTEGSAMASVDG